jgi:hypothetical protein
MVYHLVPLSAWNFFPVRAQGDVIDDYGETVE